MIILIIIICVIILYHYYYSMLHVSSRIYHTYRSNSMPDIHPTRYRFGDAVVFEADSMGLPWIIFIISWGFGGPWGTYGDQKGA